VKESELSFRSLLDETTVQKFLVYLKTRAISPGRIYQLILAMTKALNYIVSLSREQGIIIKGSSLPTWELLANAGKIKNCSERRRVRSRTIVGPTAAGRLTQKELALLYFRCQERLQELQKRSMTKKLLQDYLAHFVVLLMVSIPTPRIQVLRNLDLGTTLLMEGENYLFSFDGENPPLKSKKPLVQVMPQHITKPLDFWITQCRPLLVGEAKHNIVFPNAAGTGRRRDWSPLTRTVTLRYLQKAISPGRFRSHGIKIIC
jgi:hypothetical protein